jgi:Xaa-Pro aminopeptidase
MKIGKEFIKRQKYLLEQIGNKSIAIVGAGFKPAPTDFYYLTGFEESDAFAVFVPSRTEGEYILFNKEKNPQEELWTGLRIGQQKACEDYGANQAFPITKADTILPDLIAGRERIYFNLDNHESVMNWLKALSDKERADINLPTDFIDVSKIIHEMRIVKDEAEIALLRKAAQISAAAHLRAMRACRPGMMEYELEAELAYEFIRNNGRFAFETVVASGANACILHYMQNDAELKSGDLILIDASAEYKHYAGDISRTFPVNAKFSEEQKAIYQAVLDTQLAVIEHIRPGVSWLELQQLSERLITEKLIELKLLHGKIDDLLQKRAFEPFYMHKIGHWLGLDCHDVGRYKVTDEWRKLEPGMVLTVEPGIYIAEKGIGVRIEDDVLITKDGCEVLTADVPKSIAEIEEIMR